MHGVGCGLRPGKGVSGLRKVSRAGRGVCRWAGALWAWAGVMEPSCGFTGGPPLRGKGTEMRLLPLLSADCWAPALSCAPRSQALQVLVLDSGVFEGVFGTW